MEFPDKNPETLEECLDFFKSIRYECNGAPFFFLDYNYSFKTWDCVFRNPVNFSNPNIGAKTPLEACHKMLDFLRDLHSQKQK